MLLLTQLVGFGAGQPTAPLTVSFIDTTPTDGPNNNFSFPASMVAGDLLILAQYSQTSGGYTTPSGFTSIIRVDNAAGAAPDPYCEFSYKIATGAETGTLAGMTGGYSVLQRFRGSRAITGATVGFSSAQATDANPSAIVITSGSGIPPLVVVGMEAGVGAFSTFSPAADGAGNNNGFQCAYKVYNSLPADVTIDMNDGGNDNVLMGIYLALTG